MDLDFEQGYDCAATCEVLRRLNEEERAVDDRRVEEIREAGAAKRRVKERALRKRKKDAQDLAAFRLLYGELE